MDKAGTLANLLRKEDRNQKMWQCEPDPFMNKYLITLEQKGLELRKAGRLAEAAEIFAIIVKEQPDWEHGTGFYNLATCYEDLGELALAEQGYREALRYEPKNPYFLGGLASFLYLHGDTNQAFASHLDLLEVERASGNQRGMQITRIALEALGKKMGLKEEDIARRIGLGHE
jgi:tetratricopeptide (TPR) repeat protein